jgi:hypothetical protein
MDIQLRTYRVTESNGHTAIVHRSDEFITKLCLGIAGGGFNEQQKQMAAHLRDELLCQGHKLRRNGCDIELIDATVTVVVLH